MEVEFDRYPHILLPGVFSLVSIRNLDEIGGGGWEVAINPVYWILALFQVDEDDAVEDEIVAVTITAGKVRGSRIA